MRRSIARLARMDRREARVRMTALARSGRDRIRVRWRGSRWNRADLAARLTPEGPRLREAINALRRHHWLDAHRALQSHLLQRPPAFVLNPSDRPWVVGTVQQIDPSAREQAAAVAERLVGGQHDLLGYRGLDFGTPPGWHRDPVHGTRSPQRFWADIPFLDPQLGDHKVIWEINRHQHWIVLGRAYWLTGDTRFRRTVLTELGGWMASNPPLIGINWASMLELAFRCLSWTWALHLFVQDDEPESGPSDPNADPWLVDLLLGLDRQLTHIEQNLSYYFSPNTHLLGEGLALYVTGQVFPEFHASNRRVTRGRAILLDGLRQQVERDGGHRERSTHYHRYTLDFYLLALAVARLSDDPAAIALADGVERLAAAARLLADDHGRLPHLGDDDGGMLLPLTGRPADSIDDSLFIAAALTGRTHLAVGPAREEAAWMLAHPHLRSTLTAAAAQRAPDTAISGALTATGYFVSRSANGDHLVIDGGPHGYLNGGHAHADALSCTLTVAGHPFLVDPGTASYTVAPALRDRFRASRLHNTVDVDGRSQSQPRGPFHWSQVADARAVRWQTGTQFDYFEGAHDGYAPLEHRRHVLAIHGDVIVVADRIDGAGHHRADAHWHVHPSWQVHVTGASARAAILSDDIQLAWAADSVRVFVGDDESGLGWYSPVYGQVTPLTTLRLTRSADTPFWLCTAFGLDRSNPVQRLEELPMRAHAGGSPGSRAGFRIHRSHSIDDIVFAVHSQRESSWRVEEYESDARALFCRQEQGRVSRLAFVDTERVHVGGSDDVSITCPQPVRGMHVLFTVPAAAPSLVPATGQHADDRPRRPATRALARVSGSTLGVQLTVAGHPLALAPERRAHVRAASTGAA